MAPQLRKQQLVGVVGALTVALAVLFSVLGLPAAAEAAIIVGFLLVLPVVAIRGEQLPIVEKQAQSSETDPPAQSPIEQLRVRYARGEVTDEEFERRLERLLGTEPVDEPERSDEREFA